MPMAAIITFPTPSQQRKYSPPPLPLQGGIPSFSRLLYFCRNRSFPLNFNCRVSRRISNYGRICVVHGLKENVWEGNDEDRRSFQEEEGVNVEAYYEEEEDDEEEEDRSLDLLARFIHHMFKKISRKTRKVARTILPSAISPQLVTFSVNGVIILTFLSILKAFLQFYHVIDLFCCFIHLWLPQNVGAMMQVLCTLGNVVFVTILLLRLIWSAVTYVQKSGKTTEFHGDNGYSSYNASQPAT